jgi:hypothetical protein
MTLRLSRGLRRERKDRDGIRPRRWVGNEAASLDTCAAKTVDAICGDHQPILSAIGVESFGQHAPSPGIRSRGFIPPPGGLFMNQSLRLAA